MTVRFLAATLGIVLTVGLAGTAMAQEAGSAQDQPKEKAAPDAAKAGTPKGKAAKEKDATSKEKAAKDATPESELERATFGGGCFWCMEAVFERVTGVKSVVSGYAGGTVARPDYYLVGTGLTGHAEAIQIVYDPKVVSYDSLLKVFWLAHDPTTLNRQGPDEGTQYRSIILYHNEEQRKAALKSYEKMTASHAYASPIVTQLVPLRKFYPAEKYHQDYFRRHPDEPYCQVNIIPKIQALKIKLQNDPLIPPKAESTKK
jgi:peptide-methionine (S)-S-oxide reductase